MSGYPTYQELADSHRRFVVPLGENLRLVSGLYRIAGLRLFRFNRMRSGCVQDALRWPMPFVQAMRRKTRPRALRLEGGPMRGLIGDIDGARVNARAAEFYREARENR